MGCIEDDIGPVVYGLLGGDTRSLVYSSCENPKCQILKSRS